MDRDDENYELMVAERNIYMDEMLTEAKAIGVEVTEYEKEEIELAFEYAFCKGFICCQHRRKVGELN